MRSPAAHLRSALGAAALSLAACSTQTKEPLDPGGTTGATIELKLTTSPAKPRAGEPVQLTIELSSRGARLSRLDTEHEKRLHLLIVTSDLARFAHEHPEPLPDGSFLLAHTFPEAGRYRLFADFRPAGRAGVVLSTELAVSGPTPPRRPLLASDLGAPREVDGYEVRLASPVPTAGAEQRLTFAVTRGGEPVLLEPYLGALGHLVVIGSDARTFLHAHPVTPPEQARTAAGVAAFATTFPAPGLYKAWVQVKLGGKVITADLVLDLSASAPASAASARSPGHQH